MRACPCTARMETGVGIGEAPTTHAMERVSPDWSLQPLTMELVAGMTAVYNEGFGSKRCCICFPFTDTDGTRLRYYQRHPERLPMCGIAVGADGTPLGFVQVAVHPMQDQYGIHTLQPGEAYIEQVGVAAAARGKGIGKALLQWAETLATDRKSSVLTLTVLHGNPALRLYERFGFEALPPPDPVERCFDICGTFWIVGRPYGLCDPHWGSVEMRKDVPGR